MKLPDQLQFMADLLADFFRNALRVAPGRACPGELRQIRRGRLPGRHNLVGIFVAQLVQRKCASLGHFNRSLQCPRQVDPQAMHFLWRFDEPLAVGK